MTGRGIKKVLDDLRSARILVLHPRDEDGDALIRQLRRIGCDVRAAWPIPDEVPKDINVVFVLVEHAGPDAFPWTTRSDGPVVIGLVDYENPTTLKALNVCWADPPGRIHFIKCIILISMSV